MGRKRKTRWRRLSIGGNSGDEEEAERESEILGFSKMNPPSRLRSGSQPAIVSSYASSATPFDHSAPTMNGGSSGAKYNGSAGHSTESKEDSGHSRINGYGHDNPHHHNGHRGGYHGGYKESRHGDGSYNGYHSNGTNGYYPANNFYRNSYNSRDESYHPRGGSGYRGRGNDYHSSSRFGGRFRKPRPYGSNYYYNNGPSSSGGSDDGTNRPSYNQEEYTKITTPRQDVLFKKGYLSQRKPVTQASSVDSTSGPTTPSTNGTPDTQSTNGLNSDYPEGYDNGETECGLVPYDDTLYYGLPPDAAVFTDPNTGQVYYGQSNGEYFDAYPLSPVMMGGYPTPLYYHVPYPGTDWNGLPTPIYPIVPLGPPPLDEHQSIQNGDPPKSDLCTAATVKVTDGSTDAGKDRNSRKDPTPAPLTNGTHKNYKHPGKKHGGESGGGANNGTLSDSSSSSREGSTSTLSSAASTPMSPPIGPGQLMTSLGMSMSNMTLVDGQVPPQQLQSIPAPHPMSHFMVPPLPNQLLYHPHSAAFVFAPPMYNGVVAPIAPVASSGENQSSPSSRKKRKLRRRKKDDGQSTDESSAEDENASGPPASPCPPNPDLEELTCTDETLALNLSSSQPSSSVETSPSKSSLSTNQETATQKDLLTEEEHCPEIPTQDLVQAVTDHKEANPQKQILEAPIPAEDKPKETPVSQETTESQQNNNPASESTTEVVTECATTLSSKKPLALLNLDIISAPEGLEGDEGFLPVEPSTPDSLNTTQSLAGSEIPSVSISETDFMNRTTSVDEVEEDLPPEDSDVGSDPVRSLQKSRSASLEDETEPLTSSISAPVSIPTRGPIYESSSSVSPKESEVTPSPETKFERSLEPLVSVAPERSAVKIEAEAILSQAPIESVTVLGTEQGKEEEIVQVVTEECYKCTVAQSQVECPNLEFAEEEPNRPNSSILDRPQSITLTAAVTEWLKVQGPDALTPVSQLQLLFEDEEDLDTDEDSESLTPEDLTKFDSSSGPDEEGRRSNCTVQ